MEWDAIETVGDSRIQHGKLNDRVYIMRLGTRGDAGPVLSRARELSSGNGYGKIFAKIPRWALKQFLVEGYMLEACVPRMYSGNIDGFFLSRYNTLERVEINLEKAGLLRDVLAVSASKNRAVACRGSEDYAVRILSENDLEMLAGFYGLIFRSYPFPITDPGFLKESLCEGTRYYGAFSGDSLVGASSAEVDSGYSNVEFTDLAVDPDHLRRGIPRMLLEEMEQDMKDLCVETAYTIARSASYGVNILFSRAGYRFAGLIANNTQICGSIESMNVWYKAIR